MEIFETDVFSKPSLDRACKKAEEWGDDDKRVLIHFYNGPGIRVYGTIPFGEARPPLF